MNKLEQIKKWLQEKELDAFLVSKPVNSYYLSGFTGTSSYLLITLMTNKNFLITDFRYQDQAEAQTQNFEIVVQEMSLFQTLGELFSKHGIKKVGLDKDDITLAMYEGLKEHVTDTIFFSVQDPCVEFRKVKASAEIKLIKKAVEIADKAFLHILEYLRPGLTEAEIALELDFFMRRLGGTKNAFETIVASGKRSALPHGVATNKTIQAGDIVTLDFGAVYQGYHSDLTRTIIIGTPDVRQQEIFDLVLQAQEEVFRDIRPGMRGSEADTLARKLIQDAGYGSCFGHGLGHGVGLEIHERPRLSPRDDTILEPGMVVTVEPGIYLSDWGGVRTEDMLVITPDGCERLTEAPKVFKL